MRLLLTRPTRDSTALVEHLKKIGFDSIIEPLLDIHIITGPDLDCKDVAALAMTSANGVRAFSARSKQRNIPLYAVGDSTAQAARNHGFSNVQSAAGTVGELAALIASSTVPYAGKILHPAASHVAGDLERDLSQAGFSYRRKVIYEAVPAHNLSPVVVNKIQAHEIDGVMLFSPRTGHIFKDLVKKAGLINDLKSMRAYCLSAAVAETIGGMAWIKVYVAKYPNQEALLKLLKNS